MPDPSRPDHTALLDRLEAARAKRSGVQESADARLRALGWRLARARATEREKLFEEVARKSGVDLQPHKVEHAKANELMRRALEEEVERLGDAAVAALGARKKVLAAVQRLSNAALARSAPAASTLVCDWNAERAGGRRLDVYHAPLVDEAAETSIGAGLGENRLRARYAAGGDSYLEREDWFDFVWQAPGPGLLSATGYICLSGTMSAFAGSGCEPLYGALAQVVGKLQVATTAGHNLIPFPLEKKVLFTTSALEGESEAVSLTGEHALDSSGSIPVPDAGAVVTSVSLRSLVYATAGARASIDLNSKSSFGAQFLCVILWFQPF